MADAILTLNAGSSSLKLALFARETSLRAVLRGQVEHLDATPRLTLKSGADRVVEADLPPGQHDEYLRGVLDAVRGHLGGERLTAVGHRVVHGGPAHVRPARVDAALLAELAALTPLAPLHQGHNLAPMRALQRLDPALPQIACFDTAFHHTLPDEACRFAIPRALHDSGVRRYGAHGLSYEYIAGELARSEPALARGRVVVAHLGNGASLCALADCRSVDTTMGMTPLDGLLMGTRCGTIDPGVLLYLMQARGMDAAALEDLLYHRSGLRGVSDMSSDMRDLHKAGTPAAQQAIALFVYRLVHEIATMAASLQGLDTLVFTGGIGEHDAATREAACARLGWLGVYLDPVANRNAAKRISAAHSAVTVLVMPTDEELVIARHTHDILGDS